MFKQTDDMPFVALISIRYSIRQRKGKWIDKRRKSSMFPMNWVINRVKQEIALVYDELVKVYGISKKNEFTLLESTGKFEILIKVDKAGTVLNAYPVL
ncbi:hypothetical protein [Flavobacterium sp. JP2137]|uniref:hypothetical protein n=1 Tax=Flavobacterium sp. JP2137 TaxID=3414510 RepID=UPI003D2FF23E